jgi:hypothetical protein
MNMHCWPDRCKQGLLWLFPAMQHSLPDNDPARKQRMVAAQADKYMHVHFMLHRHNKLLHQHSQHCRCLPTIKPLKGLQGKLESLQESNKGC